MCCEYSWIVLFFFTNQLLHYPLSPILPEHIVFLISILVLVIDVYFVVGCLLSTTVFQHCECISSTGRMNLRKLGYFRWELYSFVLYYVFPWDTIRKVYTGPPNDSALFG